MDRCVPRICLEVGSVLAPERALLSDLRYVRLLDVAHGVDATGILTMTPDGTPLGHGPGAALPPFAARDAAGKLSKLQPGFVPNSASQCCTYVTVQDT